MPDAPETSTDQDWALVAEQSPYWAVLSSDEYRGNALSEDKAQKFFASGEHHIANLFATISHHFGSPFSPVRSLDFGCGVGRLLVPIAQRCQEAVGVDVAPRMLELCQRHLGASGVTNVSLVLSDDELSRVEGRFDFVNTLIVLQHIPAARGYNLISKLVNLLMVGGTGSLQLTFAKSRRFFSNEANTARFYRRDGRSIVDLVAHENIQPVGQIRMFDYDLNYVFALLSESAGTPLIVLPTNDDEHLGLNIIFRRAR
jgi:SAM-dependent methyltransferase